MVKGYLIIFALLNLFSKNNIFSSQTERPQEVYEIIPNQLQWKSNPALPKEIQVAILFGDPNRNGPFVMRFKIPAGSKVAPHWHPIPENATVLSGSLNVGSGDRLDQTKGIHLPAGSFVSIPAKHHHYAWFTEDTVLQFNNFGRWEIHYVNPKDDPRNH